MATVDDVRNRDLSGSFAALSDETIELFLADAALRMDASVWGDCADLAQVYLTLHMLTGATYGVASGPLASASAGGISTAFAVIAGTHAVRSRWLDLFEELGQACGVTGPMVVVGQPL
jgi:hypothetical protein